MEWQEKIIELGESITYVPRTKEYGCAEFSICLIFKRGHIRGCYIYPIQQVTNTYYRVTIPDTLKLRIIYFSSHYPDEPRIWRTWWCKEHKCHALEFYVPKEGNSFTVNCSMGDTLLFDWH